jgi:hypothetical protein
MNEQQVRRELAEKVKSGGIVACACMGAVYGEPHCPCEMTRRGLPSSPAHIAANEKANEDLKKLFGPGGPFHRPTPVVTETVSATPDSPTVA